MQLRPSAYSARNISLKSLLVFFSLFLSSASAFPQAEPTWQEKLDLQLVSWENKAAPAISIAVVKSGTVLYCKSRGMANIGRGVASDSTSQFWVASVSKQFTAAAVYRLVQRRGLSLATSIRSLLPELPPLYQPVTIAHLLHHTGGIRDGFVLTALSKKPPSAYTNENVLRYLKASKNFNFWPGTRFEYNNAGYVLLAMAIEKVSGVSFPNYLKDSIFQPLGMHHSYVSSSFPVNAKQAEGYREVSPNTYEAYHFEGQTYGSTGVITTLSDLVRWSQFLQRPQRVPSLAFLGTLLFKTGTLHNRSSIAYAGGLEKFTYNGRTVYEHFGADEGVKADILYFPATGVAIIGLTNNGNFYGLLPLLYGISDLVHEEERVLPPPVDEAGEPGAVSYYYNAAVPQLARLQHFPNFIKIGNTVNGYAAPYRVIDDTLRSQDPVPTVFLQRKEYLEVLDNYYQNHTRLERIQPVVKRDDLARLVGHYYAEELQTAYRVLLTEKGLQFEFLPGMTFDLFRMTGTDFVFDYLGPNYLQFSKDGFSFSREGCRKLFFKKQS